MLKRVLNSIASVLIITTIFTGCTEVDNHLADKTYTHDNLNIPVIEVESLNTYFEKRVLLDSEYYIYDMITNEGAGAVAGGVAFTLDIVDPVYYGKATTDILAEIQNMGNNLDLENQVNGMYNNPVLKGEDGSEHIISNTSVFWSTTYTTVENMDWVFLMSNYDRDDTHVCSLMGVAKYYDKWAVINLTSEFSEYATTYDITKAVYQEFYEKYNLSETALSLEQLMNVPKK